MTKCVIFLSPQVNDEPQVGHDRVLFNSYIFIVGKGKGIVVPVLFVTEHHAMKAYWGSGGIAPFIL
jgi:hypothetical protein